MPKENKTSGRRSRRQCPEVDTETVTVSGARELVKSMIGGNRYSPFPRETPRRDTRAEKENMAVVPSTEALQTMSDGIIGSGIKYIMFPLHLLRFCIFGTNSRTVASENKQRETQKEMSTEKTKKTQDKGRKEEERDGKGATDSKASTRRKEDRPKENCLKEERKSSESSSSATARKEDPKEVDKSGNEGSTGGMVTAAEDSDSSTDHWSSASSMMNMSLDCDNIDKSMSFALLEEPMDISMEEQTYEKSHSATKPAEGNRVASYSLSGAVKSVPSRLLVDEQGSNSSVDEEIARIFQKQCTSSEDECSSSYSSSKREKPKQSNFLCSKSTNNLSTSVSRSKKEPRDDERDRRKKTSSDVVVNHKRRKVTHDEDKDERRGDRRAEAKVRDEKRSSRQDTPGKSKTRSSKTPVKNKESKRKDVKYKETATQTDSAFSDEDVEMLPIEKKLPERQFCCKYAARRLRANLFQGKQMRRELNYIPDNEDSNDGFRDIAPKRISPCSTSSSSADLGFDERGFATPEMDVGKGRRHSNSPDAINTHRMSTRAPPGFPELPQNPPLMTCTYDSKRVVTTSSRDSRFNPSIGQSTAIVPPAPSPLRHLYYDYPEFMNLPAKGNSSKILTNILQNNYYR